MPVSDTSINTQIDNSLPDNVSRSITSLTLRGILKAVVLWVKTAVNDTQAQFAAINVQVGVLSFTKNIQGNSSVWIDVLAGSERLLTSGMYAVQVYVSSGGGQFYMYWGGVMSWIDDGTNGSDDVCEIPLHFVGHARSGATLQLRTIMTGSSSWAKLQIRTTTTPAPYAILFKFKKLI